MVHILDVLLVLLGADLGVVGYLVLRGSALKARHSAHAPYASLRRRLRLPSMPTISTIVLLLAGVLYLGRHYVPQLHGLFSRTSESCDIKGNISTSGERIYHLPTDRYYDATGIAQSRGERWFCSESEAIAAGWRRAKV